MTTLRKLLQDSVKSNGVGETAFLSICFGVIALSLVFLGSALIILLWPWSAISLVTLSITLFYYVMYLRGLKQ